MKRALILGAGMAGCSIAKQLTRGGQWEVLLLEAGAQLGCDAHTRTYAGHEHTLAPQLLQATSTRALDFLRELGSLCERPSASVPRGAGSEIVGLDAQVLEARWLAAAAQTLDPAYFGTESSLPSSPSPDHCASLYPTGRGGYNEFLARCVADSTLLLETSPERIDLEARRVQLDGQRLSFDLLVNTGPLDDLFGQCLGRLRYIGMDQSLVRLPGTPIYPGTQSVAYQLDAALPLRCTDYGSFAYSEAPGTLLGIERPSLYGRRFALPFASQQQLATRYLSELPPGVHSIGGLGSYRVGLGAAGEVQAALHLAEELGILGMAA